MKKWIALALVLTMALTMAACGCEHAFAPATCNAPSTCTLCGKTEGETLSHVWMAATCEDPKTCELCGAAEGEAKGHALVEATCEDPKHCENCRYEEGEALGHTWLEATTEEPKTCETCGETEGERIITDFRFTTEATKDVQGKWMFELNLTGEMLGEPSITEAVPIHLILDFRNDGTYGANVQVTDRFVEVLIQYTVEEVYAQAAAEGISKEEMDADIQAEYGMTLYELLAQDMDKDTFNEAYSKLFERIGFVGVYYIDNGMFYSGADWNVMMDVYSYTLDGDDLTIKDFMYAGEETFDIVGKRLVTEE